MRMGRHNPKLPPFLKLHLEEDDLKNLKWEDENKGIFYIELPHFDKDKCREYEKVLIAWYKFNGKSHKYKGYSNGKSVVKAALKKSVYLIALPSIGKQMRFQFATSDQVKENKRLLKENGKSDVQPTSLGSPSVASSDDQNDSKVESVQITEVQDAFWNDGNQFSGMQDVFLNDVLNNPEKYIDGFDDLCKELCVDIKEKMPLQNIQLDAFKPQEELSQYMRPATELKPTPVGVPGTSIKKYWLCTQKIAVKTTLLLMCELKVIENDSSGIKEGSVVIPNKVFEPGISYELKKYFELDNIQYYFFSPKSI